MAKTTPPPGTSDITPEEVSEWYCFEDTARRIFPLYGYGELRTPIFEYTEIFERGLGDETEVVQKEMYTFEDRGGRSLTLRPEGTAGVMRALAGTDVMNGIEKRVYYMGPMFRGERPAAGRRRQFHQVGVENAGRVSPELDAECIAMLMHYLQDLGINDAELLINTRGAQDDRPPAAEALKSYFSKFIEGMCDDCKARIDRNVWRILDCKQKECQEPIENAPDVVSFFSDETRSFFDKVCQQLDELGIKYKVDSRLVRGLDYYVHTVFEVTHSGVGAQSAIAGGGRYEVFLPDTKKPVIGVGWAAGLERLLMARESLNVSAESVQPKPVYLVGLGENAVAANQKLAAELRQAGIAAIPEVEAKSMKAQMRTANRLSADTVIIRGEDELAKGIAMVRNMASGEQQEVAVGDVVSALSV